MKKNTKLIILKFLPCFQILFGRLIGGLRKYSQVHYEQQKESYKTCFHKAYIIFVCLG